MATETTKKATETEKKTDASKTETTTKKPAASSKTAANDVKSTESKTTVEKKNDTKKSEKSDTSTTSDKKSTEKKVEKKTETTKSEEVKTKVEPEKSDKSDKSVEVSEPSKEDVSTEMKHEEERTLFALELKRKVPMYTHMSMNAACRMIKGNVICKSDKPTNGWITIYAGIPEIGKVTGYIRIEQLGWR